MGNMIEITDIKLLPLPWSGKVMLFGTRSDEEKIKILTYLGIEWDCDTGKTGKCFATLTEHQKCEGLKAWQRSFGPAPDEPNTVPADGVHGEAALQREESE